MPTLDCPNPLIVKLFGGAGSGRTDLGRKKSSNAYFSPSWTAFQAGRGRYFWGDICHIATRVPELIEDATNELPVSFRLLIERLVEHLNLLNKQVIELESQIRAWHRESELSRKHERIPGIGPVTASALVATSQSGLAETRVGYPRP